MAGPIKSQSTRYNLWHGVSLDGLEEKFGELGVDTNINRSALGVNTDHYDLTCKIGSADITRYAGRPTRAERRAVKVVKHAYPDREKPASGTCSGFLSDTNYYTFVWLTFNVVTLAILLWGVTQYG